MLVGWACLDAFMAHSVHVEITLLGDCLAGCVEDALTSLLQGLAHL